MIDNKERREIASRLRDSRDYASCLPKFFMPRNDLFERVLACVHYEGGNLFDHLADLIDRPTCRNVYDETEMGACANGFECSVCGNRVEDYEHCCITGTFNCCSKCEREVVSE